MSDAGPKYSRRSDGKVARRKDGKCRRAVRSGDLCCCAEPCVTDPDQVTIDLSGLVFGYAGCIPTYGEDTQSQHLIISGEAPAGKFILNKVTGVQGIRYAATFPSPSVVTEAISCGDTEATGEGMAIFVGFDSDLATHYLGVNTNIKRSVELIAAEFGPVGSKLSQFLFSGSFRLDECWREITTVNDYVEANTAAGLAGGAACPTYGGTATIRAKRPDDETDYNDPS